MLVELQDAKGSTFPKGWMRYEEHLVECDDITLPHGCAKRRCAHGFVATLHLHHKISQVRIITITALQ